MLPGFLVLLAAAAGVRLTARRCAFVVVSGLVLVIVFALINYLVPATGHSDIGHFAGHVSLIVLGKDAVGPERTRGVERPFGDDALSFAK